MTDHPKSAVKGVIANIFLAGLSVLVSCVILEVIARISTGAPWPERLPVVRVKADPDVGWIMLPHDFHYTYTIPVQLNSLGFRGPEVPEKTQTEYRILAIGDSMIYAQGVDDEHIMTARLQRILDERRPDCHVRIINMGVRAYQTNQELALLKKFGLKLHPDMVLLFFFLNDFDSTNIPRRYARFKDIDWYMFDLGGKPEGQILEAWKFRQMLRHSSLIAHLYRAYIGFEARNQMEFRLLRGEHDPGLDAKVEEIAGYMHEFHELSKANEFAFRLIATPVAEQINHQYPHARYQSELKKMADRDGIPFLDMLPAFDADYLLTGSRHQIPFDGHPDARGNEIMAQAVADDLTSRGPGCLNKPG